MSEPSSIDRYLPKLSERGRRWVRFFALVAAAYVLVRIAVALHAVLTPIVAALAVAYVLNPLITWLEENRGIRRATSVSVGLALLVLAGFTLLFIATVQVIQLADDAPLYAQRFIQWVHHLAPNLFGDAQSAATQPSAPAGAAELQALATKHALAVGRSVVAYITGLLSNLFYWLSLTVLLPVYTFVFLLHFNDFVYTLRDHLPAAYRPTIVRVVRTIDQAVSTFFRGRLIVCLVVGLITGVGWLSLSLVGVRVPYNLALGLLAGVLNLVPFLSVLAVPPALLLTYFEAMQNDENWVVAVTLVIGVYMLAQAIESFVLTPTIEAQASGLHPVTTIVALLIGGELAGLLGMLLAIPLASTLKSLSQEYLLPEIRRLAELEQPSEPTGQ